MKTPVWLLKETVLALHERLLAEFSGSPGLRDESLLESALARPEKLDGAYRDGHCAVYRFGRLDGAGQWLRQAHFELLDHRHLARHRPHAHASADVHARGTCGASPASSAC